MHCGGAFESTTDFFSVFAVNFFNDFTGLECWGCRSSLQCCGNLWPKARYPSMTTVEAGKTIAKLKGSESKVVLFGDMGMTCAACTGSVEKTIKRLPGIREAMVDVLNHKAEVEVEEGLSWWCPAVTSNSISIKFFPQM
ncbi:hypothetical protein VIGAN_02266500 [Vigna angularis var. angularis]|uniref:HMA domain-containing protein n=1 Tax=Vigna angularis var. angularis TaxID=157739 RepID=A0A0S3RGF2_PHAAN|nr:hypothetical protein VIGAN_02266500 [Vigna angularis var. angularis]